MFGLSIKTESAHADQYINTCLHRHSLLSTYNTQEVELLRAYCSDNCLFGQRETNAAEISSESTSSHVQSVEIFGPDIKRMSLRGGHASV